LGRSISELRIQCVDWSDTNTSTHYSAEDDSELQK
jgi:hypothetical protein